MRKSLTDFRHRCSWAATFLAGQRVQVRQWTLADCVASAAAILPEGRPLSLLAQEGIDQTRQMVDNVVQADHFRMYFLEGDRPVETDPRHFRSLTVREVWWGSFHGPPP